MKTTALITNKKEKSMMHSTLIGKPVSWMSIRAQRAKLCGERAGCGVSQELLPLS